MSDFDAVLERLLNEPAFAATLAGDPDVALAGYRLDESEIALLRSQVAGDTAADVARVETRTSKSSTFGLLAPFAALGGLGELGQHLGGHEPGGAGGMTPRTGLGGPAHTGLGGPAHTAGLGDAPAARSGLGAPAHDGLGDAPRQGLGGAPRGHAEPEELAPPKGYRNRVDADGDGDWDKATYYGRRGGGAEIHVDLDGDGRADFVGHDVDLDNRVDYADYDKNQDGVFEKRMYDDDNDGWLDRTVRRNPKN